MLNDGEAWGMDMLGLFGLGRPSKLKQSELRFRWEAYLPRSWVLVMRVKYCTSDPASLVSQEVFRHDVYLFIPVRFSAASAAEMSPSQRARCC